ncbi:enkurin [Odontesthes bonariensis]|uniref:enkurin n=1 Tax=Odontesthes bonariensis TaxID=219752 RepID=UPI003F588C41
MAETIHPRESVYNWIPEEEEKIEKPKRYVSKFRPAVVLESKVTKDARRMMGPAKLELPSPHKYLKKHSKDPKLSEKPQPSKDARSTCACTEKKPAVPARTDPPPMGIQTKRDFTKTTIFVPVKPKPTYVDTNKGHKELLENSGLVPKYLLKKDYGEAPLYLRQRNEAERRAQEENDRLIREEREQAAMHHLSDEERHAVLQDMKKNWDALHREYQGLSLIIDTLSKKAHKIRLEEAMKQLEQDISLFERCKTIYIPNN